MKLPILLLLAASSVLGAPPAQRHVPTKARSFRRDPDPVDPRITEFYASRQHERDTLESRRRGNAQVVSDLLREIMARMEVDRLDSKVERVFDDIMTLPMKELRELYPPEMFNAIFVRDLQSVSLSEEGKVEQAESKQITRVEETAMPKQPPKDAVPLKNPLTLEKAMIFGLAGTKEAVAVWPPLHRGAHNMVLRAHEMQEYLTLYRRVQDLFLSALPQDYNADQWPNECITNMEVRIRLHMPADHVFESHRRAEEYAQKVVQNQGFLVEQECVLRMRQAMTHFGNALGERLATVAAYLSPSYMLTYEYRGRTFLYSLLPAMVFPSEDWLDPARSMVSYFHLLAAHDALKNYIMLAIWNLPSFTVQPDKNLPQRPLMDLVHAVVQFRLRIEVALEDEHSDFPLLARLDQERPESERVLSEEEAQILESRDRIAMARMPLSRLADLVKRLFTHLAPPEVPFSTYLFDSNKDRYVEQFYFDFKESEEQEVQKAEKEPQSEDSISIVPTE